jgi:hypothetical protein
LLNLQNLTEKINAGGGEHEGRLQTGTARHLGAARGQALADTPALKPYRGKLAVRNFRGDDGNVGIIRSPLRAIVLPDRAVEASKNLGFKPLRFFLCRVAGAEAQFSFNPLRPD